MLEIRDFSKSYKGGIKAVDHLSLTVEQGDLYGFIGHNGAGKTTLIRSIVGVLEFEEGEIYINGNDIRRNPIACKQITAYLPDNPDLYEHLTGIQYLNFIADIFGMGKAEREIGIKGLSEEFEIEKDLGNLISSYSHGMKQKLAIIGALIHQPRLLVMDEPFVGLDPKASLILKNKMRDLCDSGGSIFFSTHVLDVAEKLCNKVAIIKKGKLLVSGKMEEVLANQSLEEVFMEVVEHV